MKRIIRLNESDLTRLVKRIIKEQQLSQNQRQASRQFGPVSKERADQLGAGGKLNVDVTNNPALNCVKNKFADEDKRDKDNNEQIRLKIEYFPDHISVFYPPYYFGADSGSGNMTFTEKFFADGRYEYFEDGKQYKERYYDGKLTDYTGEKWFCMGERDYVTRHNPRTATPGAKEPEKEQPKQTTPISNCAASLSEIKAGSNKILKKGCKTDAVKELQKMLKMEEKHHTGYFGDITKAKVIEFQKNNKDAEGKSLVPDGIVGNKTYEALVKTQTTPNTRGSQTAVQQYFDNRFSTTLPK
jgi:hypothetical protein